MSDMIQSTVYFHPLAKKYLEEIVKDPDCWAFKQSYSSIINAALEQHARRNERGFDLPPPKPRGRPPKAWDGHERREGE